MLAQSIEQCNSSFVSISVENYLNVSGEGKTVLAHEAEDYKVYQKYCAKEFLE